MSVDAAAVDRLPWLADEPAPQPLWPRYGGLLPWAVAAIAIIGAGAWLGARGAEQSAARTAEQAQSSTTVKLPPPHPLAVAEEHSTPQRSVDTALPGTVPRPAREASVAAASARQSAPTHHLRSVSKLREARHVAAVRRQPAAPTRRKAHFASGAAGRRVEIGAFGSADQAHRGWGIITREYPGMTDLRAVVRQARNSKGRTFYRFDVGTTSQAHSEVLCQRMAKIGLSCAVVGLPAKTKAKR